MTSRFAAPGRRRETRGFSERRGYDGRHPELAQVHSPYPRAAVEAQVPQSRGGCGFDRGCQCEHKREQGGRLDSRTTPVGKGQDKNG